MSIPSVSTKDAKWFRRWVRSACAELEVTLRSLGDLPGFVIRDKRWIENGLTPGRALGTLTAAEILDRVKNKVRYNKTHRKPLGRFSKTHWAISDAEVVFRIPELLKLKTRRDDRAAMIVFRGESNIAAKAVLAALDAIPGAPIIAERNKARVLTTLRGFFTRYERLWDYDDEDLPEGAVPEEINSILTSEGKASSGSLFRAYEWAERFQTPSMAVEKAWRLTH